VLGNNHDEWESGQECAKSSVSSSVDPMTFTSVFALKPTPAAADITPRRWI
jgi:hypothetical protein